MTTARTILLLIALLYWSGCSDPSSTDPAEGVGPVIADYVLTAQDGNALPCCVFDSANVRITVVGGALTFHAPADYRDVVFTPAGPASRACVHGVPNGAFVNTFTYTVRLPDGTTYLQLPCDRGAYTLVVIRQLDGAGGSSTTDSVTVSSGTFNAKADTVDLTDSGDPGGFTTAVTAPTILVTAPAHRYEFNPVH